MADDGGRKHQRAEAMDNNPSEAKRLRAESYGSRGDDLDDLSVSRDDVVSIGLDDSADSPSRTQSVVSVSQAQLQHEE